MEITISFFGPTKKPWPEVTRTITVNENTTLQDILESLGYTAEDLRRVAIVVNGKRAALAHKPKEHDDVRVVLLAGGG